MIFPAKSAQELLAEFRATGRQEPFEEIVRRYAAMVFHVCFQVLKNRHDAEDATQAVFLTLAVQGKTSKPIHNIGPWLQQVAKRLSLDLRKAKKRRLAREHRHGVTNSNGDSSLALNNRLDNQELRHILSEELNHLAPKYRLPLILHYFGGLSREQMSAELGCKAATLGVRLHRGREMLAARLSQRGVALTAVGLGMLLSYMVREAVTENLVWSTSHVASQMAAGHPVGGGIVSARAIALARSAGNTLAVAKVKAIVASVLIAATAVAAGEVISKVRPLDLRLQTPAGDGLLDLFRPKLPELRSDTTPVTPPPTPSAVVVTHNDTPSPVTSKLVAAEPTFVFQPAAGADWGGSILGGAWIGSATSTHIPGIAWSSQAPPPYAGVPDRLRGYAVGPLAAPLVRSGNGQQLIGFVPQQLGPGSTSDPSPPPPYASVPPKPKRKAAPSRGFEMRSLPVEDPPAPPGPPTQLVINDRPKLFLEPASVDARMHPHVPAIYTDGGPSYHSTQPGTLASTELLVTSSGTAFAFTGYSISGSPAVIRLSDVELNGSTSDVLSYTSISSDVAFVVNVSANHVTKLHPVQIDRNPVVLARSAFEGISTISSSPGVLKGYGTANTAAEFNHNGQVIADGGGQERTLDLSGVGTIKNSIDNPRFGHNGWFAQNKGKLVLPAVALNNGTGTWGEDSADPQIDLVNSVRIKVNPEIVGSIKLSLLSTDRTDYPAMPANLKPIGLWQVEPMELVLASVDLTIRYDIDLANDLHLSSGLNVWGYDGEWRIADVRSLDSYNHIIRGRLGNVDYFAVAGSQPSAPITSTPEPAALLGFVCGAIMLMRRRRRLLAGQESNACF